MARGPVATRRRAKGRGLGRGSGGPRARERRAGRPRRTPHTLASAEREHIYFTVSIIHKYKISNKVSLNKISKNEEVPSFFV